jgi:hypothetical protein
MSREVRRAAPHACLLPGLTHARTVIRMQHMLYRDTKITSAPLQAAAWPAAWDPAQWSARGCGFLLEGAVVGRGRVLLTDQSGSKVC